ncbi:MAG: putative toxin-antitoxin system toxin component, PIN family [Candidatus Hydrothermarchaeota archaeon]|nr:MAG: putative toxin-antitoxin system toxin component, PIN family [Candidatus Hydrothermarchaeota archaeon]
MCRDKEDNKFLNVAYTSKACCLITLDKDLLDLRDKNKEFIINIKRLNSLLPQFSLEFYTWFDRLSCF